MSANLEPIPESDTPDPPQTCKEAKLGFLFGWLSLVFLLLAGIPALIFGHKAMGKIERSPVPLKGTKRAAFAILMGYSSLLGTFLVPVFLAIGLPLFAMVKAQHSREVASPPPPLLPQEPIEPIVDLSSLPEISIPAPPEPSPMFEGVDLRQQTSDSLLETAKLAARKRQMEQAIQLQHWAIANATREGSGGGQYDLACFYSLEQQSTAALHWLQRAAREEGVVPRWAFKDPDLMAARDDLRWSETRDFLQHSAGYWKASGLAREHLIVPEGYQNDESIPLMIGLHGLGGSETFVHEEYQIYADRLGIAFLGVTGTVPRGPFSFVWSEKSAIDHQRVQAAMKAVENRIRIDRSKVVVFGFSQGGWVAGLLAATHPDSYCGALCLSSGYREESELARLQPSLTNKARVVVIYGGGEHPGNIRVGEDLIEWFSKTSGSVLNPPYSDMTTHAFPPDYWERLPEWIEFMMPEAPVFTSR